jgi:hypothetical protein
MIFRHDQNKASLGFFLLILLFTTSVFSQNLEHQRVKLYGVWDGTAFQINKLRYRFARKNPNRGLISGVIEKKHPVKNRLSIGPFRYRIAWNQRTKFLGMTEDELVAGKSVKVSVHLSKYGVLIADRFTPGPTDMNPGEVQIIGNISVAQTLANGSARAAILGADVTIPEALSSVSLQLTRRQDDRRPEDQLSVQLFDRPLVIGGEVGITSRFRKDFRLDPQRDDDRLKLDAGFQLELFYKMASNLFLFTEMSGDSDSEVYRQGGRDRTVSRRLRRGETWLFWGDIAGSGFSFQVGRQNYQDQREWWWDEDLDSVRLYYNQPFFHTELAVAQRLAVVGTDEGRIDPWKKDVLRILSRTRWEWAAKQVLGLFFLHRQDYSKTGNVGRIVREEAVDPSDSNLTWVGLRSLGKLDFEDKGEANYWLDTAWVGGKEILFDYEGVDDGLQRIDSINRRHINGWAVDVGLTWETSLPMTPSFTLGYAIGSKQFRQTGLQDNNNRFNGVDRFRYYGELSRPELANLQIWTAAAGIPLLDNSSVEFIYHYYHQVNDRGFLRNSRISADLTGDSGAIGHEWDLVIGLEEWQHLELEFVAAMFKAGSAYGELSGNMAYTVIFKANYNF